MMKLKMLAAAVLGALLMISMPNAVNAGKPQPKPAIPFAFNSYEVYLASHKLVNGNFEWTWTVQNWKDGKDGVQDLSHWGIQFGACFNINDVVGVAYSINGVSWTYLTPTFEVDRSLSVIPGPVLKFDAGTTGVKMIQYKLILSKEYTYGTSMAYFKSGSKTGLKAFEVDGPSCEATGSNNN